MSFQSRIDFLHHTKNICTQKRADKYIMRGVINKIVFQDINTRFYRPQ